MNNTSRQTHRTLNFRCDVRYVGNIITILYVRFVQVSDALFPEGDAEKIDNVPAILRDSRLRPLRRGSPHVA